MKSWVDEYQPKKLKQIVGNDSIIKKLKLMVENNNLQNLIITGFLGCGKSSSISAIINELKAEFLELNASDERNISTIRTTIKTFAMKKSFSNKIIVLEEIDNMPKGSQYGIASLMEESKSTCFILTCNDYDKIIENLTSRCIILKFEPISQKNIIKTLNKICTDKKITCDENVVNEIALNSEGDLRKAILSLQNLYLYVLPNHHITITEYNTCSTKPSSKLIQEMIYLCIKKDIKQSFAVLEKLLNQGYDCSDIIVFIYKECASSTTMNLDISTKVKYLKLIGDYHMKIIKGTSKIQLYALLISLAR